MDINELSPELLGRLAETNSGLQEYLDELNRPFLEAYDLAVEAERSSKVKYAMLVESIWDEAYKAAWKDFQEAREREELESRRGKSNWIIWAVVFALLFVFVINL